MAYGKLQLFLNTIPHSLFPRELVFDIFFLTKIPEHYSRFVSAVVNLRLHQGNREV